MVPHLLAATLVAPGHDRVVPLPPVFVAPQDEFEQKALLWLGQNPNVPFKEFTEIEGRRSLIYATARKMEESCVKCHNYPEGNSPKKDWKVGDVRGVIEVIRPLDNAVGASHSELRWTILAIIAVFDLSRVPRLAIVELAIAGAGALIAVAGFSGRYRA